MGIPCTPAEIKKEAERRQAELSEILNNPVRFWAEMGIDYAGG